MINLLNKLNKLELDNKKIFLIMLIGILIIYIDFSFLIKLQLKGIKTIGPKIIKLKTDLDNLAKELSIMEDLKHKQPQKQEDASLTKRIISNEQIPSLLQDISSMANKNKVKVIKILSSKESKTKELKPKALKTKESKIKKDSLFETSKFEPLLITLDLSSDYHHFGSFLNALENDKVFMTLEELKMKNASGDYFKQDVNLVLKTYVRK